jgi:CHAD domain-containing protein
MPKELTFAIGRDFDLAATLRGTRRSANWKSIPAETLETTYFDTFDWRLYNTASQLVIEKSPQGSHLDWLDMDSGRIKERAALQKAPDFAWNLPLGPLQKELAPIMEVRRLIPYVRIRRRIQPYVLLNKDEKIVLRLFQESVSALVPPPGPASQAKTRRKSLGHRLRVQALKGYDKVFVELTQHLQKHHDLPQAGGLLQQALDAHGITPGDYSSKLKLKLAPDQRSDAAVKQFLGQLLDTLEHNEAGIEADLDAEFLHDFRVAGRRSRSALGQIKQVMPARVSDRLKRDFAWLNQVSGPSRDMDVYLLSFSDYQASLPQNLQPALVPLRDFLCDHKQAEYKKLVRALHSARYRHFKEYLRKYLASPPPARTPLAHAKEPIAEVSGQRIWRVYRRVIKEGQAITKDSPNEALHELRKSCKKLRYLLEFCRSLYAQKAMNRLIKALKKLQDNLGEFQDYSVQIHALQTFSRQMVAEKRANAKTLLAMSQLIHILEQRQHVVREEFQQRFKPFAAQENQAIFKRLFRPNKRQETA